MEEQNSLEFKKFVENFSNKRNNLISEKNNYEKITSELTLRQYYSYITVCSAYFIVLFKLYMDNKNAWMLVAVISLIAAIVLCLLYCHLLIKDLKDLKNNIANEIYRMDEEYMSDFATQKKTPTIMQINGSLRYIKLMKIIPWLFLFCCSLAIGIPIYFAC